MVRDEIQSEVERVVKALKSFGAREVYLFGSAAAGQMGESSDLDFAVSGLPPRDFYRAVTRAMRAAGSPVDVVDLDLATPFTRHLRQEHKLVRVG
jgi:predicted nucleotidyltransferase